MFNRPSTMSSAPTAFPRSSTLAAAGAAARHETLLVNGTQSDPAFDAAGFEIRFQSLFHEGRGMCFPCDGAGHVDCDALSPRARDNYLFARAMVGREFAMPAVLASAARRH